MIKQIPLLLWIIFILGLTLRLLYFPHNVYFGNDQARDAYYSYEIIAGDLKVVGPGTTFGKYLHHGVLYYYLMGPIYYLAQGSPFVPALIINLINALGIFVIFLIAKDLFSKKVALMAAFLYAISFEQTQYALFFSHPAMATIFVLFYYWGLTRLIFKNDSRGLILAAFCAGVATQFHVSMGILIVFIPIFLIIFRSKITKLAKRDLMLALLALGSTMSSFAVAELKFGHLKYFLISITEPGASSFGFYINNYFFAVNRYLTDNLFAFNINQIIGTFLVLGIFGLVIKQKKHRATGIFLTIWFLVGCIAYIIGASTTYYFGIGGSISLLLTIAVLLVILWENNQKITIILLIIILGSNISQIIATNLSGPIDSIMAPPGLLLSDELRVIDYIYTNAEEEEFSVHALTIPYNVKSTWDYLFNWYGARKYGFVPVWGGEDALGSEGTLQVVRARSTLPQKQFLIVEPTVGLDHKIVENFFTEEGYFTHLVSEKEFGKLKVQVREKY